MFRKGSPSTAFSFEFAAGAKQSGYIFRFLEVGGRQSRGNRPQLSMDVGLREQTQHYSIRLVRDSISEMCKRNCER